MPTETLIWRDAETDPPDADITVLMAFDPDADLQFDVDMGWLDADGWHYAESGGSPRLLPKWWTDMPAGPGAAK